MFEDNSNKSSIGRQKFLGTLAGFGASVGVLGSMTQEVYADFIDDPKREAPYIRSYLHTNHQEVVERGATPERTPVYDTMPRSQWVRIKSAQDARRQVAKQIRARNEDIQTYVTTNSNGEKQIAVHVNDWNDTISRSRLSEIEDQVPGSVDGVAGRGTENEESVRGIQVSVNRYSPEPYGARTRTIEPDSIGDLNYFWDSWNDVPGGAAMGATDQVANPPGPNFAPLATTGTPIDGDKMTVAAHAIAGPGGNVGYGNIVAAAPWESSPPGFPPVLDYEFGTVNHHGDPGEKPGPDASIVSGTADVQYQFANYSGATYGDIRGTVSQTTLERIEDNGTNRYETFEGQGANTGKVSNFDIDGVGYLGFIALEEMARGDSGGPFHIDNNYPFFRTDNNVGIDSGTNWNDIAGTVQGGIPGEDFTIVHSMNRIETVTGLQV